MITVVSRFATYEFYEPDTITDFETGVDVLDVAHLLKGQTSFAGATAQRVRGLEQFGPF